MFGGAEKGTLRTPLHLPNLTNLAETLGNPPDDTLGIPFAIQALLFERTLYFVRVEEEGFSKADYFQGLSLVQASPMLPHLLAIGLPGVGDAEVIDAAAKVCEGQKSLLITSEQDLFDYLTA